MLRPVISQISSKHGGQIGGWCEPIWSQPSSSDSFPQVTHCVLHQVQGFDTHIMKATHGLRPCYLLEYPSLMSAAQFTWSSQAMQPPWSRAFPMMSSTRGRGFPVVAPSLWNKVLEELHLDLPTPAAALCCLGGNSKHWFSGRPFILTLVDCLFPLLLLLGAIWFLCSWYFNVTIRQESPEITVCLIYVLTCF